MGFEASIDKFIVKTEAKAKRVIQRGSLELHNRMAARTPVDTGKTRSDWTLEPDADGLGATIKNDAPNILVLEYGLFPNPPKAGTGKTVDGFSTQAPHGMVRLSILEWPDIVADAAK